MSLKVPLQNIILNPIIVNAFNQKTCALVFMRESNLEYKEILHLLRHELSKIQRPANEIILDDEDVMRFLKISKRNLQYLKADRTIPYHHFGHNSPRTYYLLSDILDILKENRIESIPNYMRIKY